MRFVYQLRRQRIGLQSVDTGERRATRRSLFGLGGLGIASAVICLLFLGSSIGGPALAGEAPNGPGEDATVREPSAGYVGREACVRCHEEQVREWTGSQHDLAMQEANEKTVLGNFEGAEFDYYGTVSRFYRQGGRFMVRTDGPDGTLTDYEVKYTFGVDPLQQIPDCVPRRPTPAIGYRLGHTSRRGRRAAVVPPLPAREDHLRRSAALDGALPELEQHVCRMPFHRCSQGL
jgi:hypothetical protein